MAKNTTVPIVLMIVGVSLLLGASLFALDRATSPEPDGLGTWILAVLGFVIGAASGIKGWLDWNKKETTSQVTNITASDDAQVATGEHGRNIKQGDNSQYIENFHEAPKPEKEFSPLHQLPQPPADFTGREELIEQLISDFNSHKGATISGLTGMGGIGKTALGLEVTHKIAKNYPDAQIFLDLKGTTTPLTAFDIARYVILSFEPTADLQTLDETNFQPVYQSVLHGKKALLFFDNACSAEQVAPLRPPETCAMLVTSRWTFSVPGLVIRRVDVMREVEAKTFLLELCQRIGNKAAELAKACGYLPLALRIAGSFLQVNSEWSIEKYLSQLNDRKKRLETLQQSREEVELTTEPDLLATFELSYNSLSEENQKRWRILGVFPASFASTAAQAMWEIEEGETAKILGLLRRYSLLEYDETSNRYPLHDLLADYAIKKLNDRELTLARLNHSVYYSKLLTSINQDFIKGGEGISRSLQVYDIEFLNIEVGQQTSVEYIESYRDAIDSCNNYALQGSINGFRQVPKDRIRWLENGIKAAKTLKSKQHEGSHFGNLGVAYLDLGNELEAIKHLEQHRIISHKIGDQEGEANALVNLGVAYGHLNDSARSMSLYEEAMVIARKIGSQNIEGMILGNLGILHDKQGDGNTALAFYEKALAINRKLGNKLSEGNNLGNIGLAYASLGEQNKAIDFYNERIKIAREIGDKHGESLTLNNLGTIYAELGNTDKAIEFFEQFLVIAHEYEDKRGEIAALGNLGQAYTILGNSAKVIEYYERALVIEHQIGDKNNEIADLGNLGLAHTSMGNSRKAFEAYEKQLALVCEIGDRHGEGRATINLGWPFLAWGK